MKDPRSPLQLAFMALFLVVACAAIGSVATLLAFSIQIRAKLPGYSPFHFPQVWREASASAYYWPIFKQSALIFGAAATVLFVVLLVKALRYKRELHGSARFATASEIEKSGLTEGDGIIVGKARIGMKDKYLMFGGNQFVALAAPTRSGKGVGIAIPNALNWNDSLVVTDIKGELYRITSKFREESGHKVFVFNPFDQQFQTHRWNPLDAVRRDPNTVVPDLLEIAATLYPVKAGGGGDTSGFFNNQAQSMFMAFALYLIETEHVHPERPISFGEILRQISGQGQSLPDYINALMEDPAYDLSIECRGALNRLLGASEKVLNDIKSTVEAPLTIFTSRITDAATSTSDFDLKQLRRTRMTIYMCIGPKDLQLSGTSLLVNLFFSQVLNANIDVLPEDDKTIKYKLLLLLDEFTAMGPVNTITRAVSFIAGYGIRMLTIFQSVSQLEARELYGKEGTKTLLTNHELSIVFPPRVQSDAKEISDTLGTFTEKSISRGYSSQRGGNSGGSSSVNTSDQKRELMKPQELRDMPDTDCLILMGGVKPIYAKKIRYYEDPIFKPRLRGATKIPFMDMDLHAEIVSGDVRAVRPDDIEAIANGDIELVNMDAIPPYDPANPVDVATILASFNKGRNMPATA